MSRWLVMITQIMGLLAAAGLLVSCETGSTIEQVNRPYGVLRAAVKESLPGGIRKQSENAREYDSFYFSPKGSIDNDAEKARVRESAHVTILGAGRPYTIEVDVNIEIKGNGGYEKTGHDFRRALEIAKKIQTGLSNRRDDRNMIDDFKPF
jgi:hypothetical protein